MPVGINLDGLVLPKPGVYQLVVAIDDVDVVTVEFLEQTQVDRQAISGTATASASLLFSRSVGEAGAQEFQGFTTPDDGRN